MTAFRGTVGQDGLTVLGPLDRIATTTRGSARRTPAAAPSGSSATTRDGLHRARSNRPDVNLTLRPRPLFEVATPAGGFTVITHRRRGAGQITATVGPEHTVRAVSVGLTDGRVATSTTPTQWTFSAGPGDGSLSARADGHTGAGLQLTYDFTQSTATRAAYASPPHAARRVPGQPQSFGLWIKGDGKGAWPALHL